MKVYRFSEAGVNKLLSKIRKKTLAYLPVMVIMVVGINVFQSYREDEEINYYLLFGMVALISLIIIFMLDSTAKKNKASLTSVELTLAEEYLSFKSNMINELIIKHSEICKIEQTPKGEILVFGKSKSEKIGIIDAYENHEEIIAYIKQLGTIKEGNESLQARQNKRKWAYRIIMFTPLAGLFIFENEYAKMGSVCLFFTIMLGFGIYSYMHKSVTKEFRRRYVFMMVFPAFMLFILLLGILLGYLEAQQ